MTDSILHAPVYVTDCETYEDAVLYQKIREALDALSVTEEEIRGKKVLLKPNLVLAKQPDCGATTHPAFIRAAARRMTELGAASVTVADSPGGPYNAAALSLVYRTCELAPLAAEGICLNDDFTWQTVSCRGKKLRSFHAITPLCEADVVVDLCRLKTHSLTGMTCATKNLFGIIPGVEKFEMHSSFPEIADFSEMLVDLASYVVEHKQFIALCDAVVSMEGNGPSHGIPKKTGLILASRSPFALDVIGEKIMKSEGTVLHLNAAAERGLTPRSAEDIPTLGLTEIPQFDFVRPDTDAGRLLRSLPTLFGGRLAKFFESRPVVSKARCIGCGKCVTSCPKHTITVEKAGKKKRAVIHRDNCIRCYCCQELCPIGAIDTWQNPLIKLIH